MAIADRIQSMYDNVGEVYDTITNVSLPEHKNIENIPSTIRDSYLEIMNNGIDVVWDNWEKVVGEGTELTLNNTEQAPMKVLLKGNTYQEGTPTPDYPQEVHVVSGDNSIEVCGKNLLDTQTNTRQGYISSTGLFTQNLYNIISDYIKVKPSENYTLSYKEQIGVMAISEYDSTKTFIQRQQATNKQTRTFTLTNNTKYVIVGFSNGSTVQATPEVWLSYKPILEMGSQATDYILYQSTTYPINLPEGMFLGSIGDYKDRFFKAEEGNPIYDSLDSATKQTLDSNEWYLEKKIGKVVLDGTNNQVELSNTNLFSYLISTYTSALLFSDNFKGIYNSSITGGGTALSNMGDNEIAVRNTTIDRFYIKTTNFNDKNTFNTWLSTNNTTVYYVLATPTYTKIEGTLASQLEALNGSKSYTPQTNISQNNNDMASVLNATALEEIS